ncbi:MAG: tetratricopeptide repeat protein [Ferruginibacter sp.]
MNYRCTKLFLFLCCLYGSLNCRAGILDSLRTLVSNASSVAARSEAMGSFAFELSKTKPDSALLVSLEGIKLAKQTNTALSLATCYNSTGWIYYVLGKADSAEYFLTNAKKIFNDLKNENQEARTLVNLSILYNQSQNYEKALACLLPAINLLEKGKDDKAKAYAEKMIGIIYRQQGEYDKAMFYLRASVQSFTKTNNRSYIADAASSLGALFINMRQFDSAFFYFHQSLTINSDDHNLYGMAYCCENLGDAFWSKSGEKLLQPYTDSSFWYYNKAYSIFLSLNNPADVIYEELNLGKVLRVTGEKQRAGLYLEKAFHYFDSTGDINYANEAAQQLIALYKDSHEFDKALAYAEKSQVYKDTLDSRNRSSTIANMFGKYETAKKDATIQLLNTQQKLDEQQLSRQKVIAIFSIILILLGSLLAFVLFNRNRIKQQLKEVQMRNQLSGDLHDDVGSSLSSIMLLSKMGSNKTPDETQKRLLDKIASTSKEVIDRMSDIIWTMNPKYDEGSNLKERLENYLLQARDLSSTKINWVITESLSHTRLSMELRKNIFLIFKEAVNNSLKYAAATEIKILLDRKGKEIQLHIEDDGIGFDASVVKDGNGMDTMARRAKNSNGCCRVTSIPGKGTLVEVTLNIPQNR